jgi:hypothetical protein
MLKNIIVAIAAAGSFVVPSLALASQEPVAQGQAMTQKNVASTSSRKVRSNRVAKADDKKVETKSEKKVVKVKKGASKASTGTSTTGAQNTSSTTPAAASPATAN